MKPRLTDEQILDILHLRDVEGMKYEDIGARYGRSKSAIIGLVYRVNTETDAADNGVGNGTMSERWWER